jgi:hypothetical protein
VADVVAGVAPLRCSAAASSPPNAAPGLLQTAAGGVLGSASSACSAARAGGSQQAPPTPGNARCRDADWWPGVYRQQPPTAPHHMAVHVQRMWPKLVSQLPRAATPTTTNSEALLGGGGWKVR